MSKISYEQVKSDIESFKWTLLSTEYKNLKTGLQVLCPNNHPLNITYDEWRKSSTHECPLCSKQPFVKVNEKNIKKKGYRILGLDQSTHLTGWALFENNKLINYGAWEAPGIKSTERISEIKNWLSYMCEKFQVHAVALEDIQLQKMEDGKEAVLTFKKLAHLQGVLKNYCYENSIPYLIIPPGTWRTHNNIKGRTRTDQKKNAQLKVQSIYEIKVTTDEADAILLTRYAASLHQQQEVIEF